MKKSFKIAFTLIELLVVIAIIGILSGFIVVAMSGVTNSANIAKSKIFANSLRNALMMDMVSEWKLDGSTIGNSAVVGDILDMWSTNNAVTIGTVPGPIIKGGNDCISGNCLSFDGSDDFVDFGNKTAFSMGTKDHTVSFWVNFDNATAPQIETMITCGSAADGLNRDGYRIYRANGTSQLWVLFTDGSADRIAGQLSPTGSLKSNDWYNIAVVFDRDSTAYAYINGAKQTSYSLNISVQPGDVQNSVNLSLGALLPSISYRLAGKIDEVRLFNSIVPTSQIKEQYYAGLNNFLVSSQINSSEYLNKLNDIAKR